MKILVGLALFGLVCWGGIAGIDWLETWRCASRWGGSGYENRLGGSGIGCMVNVDGRWVPESNVMVGPR